MNTLKKVIVLLVPIAFFACTKSAVNQAKIDKEIIRKYIADSSLVADSTTSGLYYVIADSGTGARPNSSSIVNVFYKGYYTSGVVFDKNEPGLPRQFSLVSVIPGWTEGVPLIKNGGKIKLLIPSALGYGPSGNVAAGIPENAVLIFDIELVNFR